MHRCYIKLLYLFVLFTVFLLSACSADNKQTQGKQNVTHLFASTTATPSSLTSSQVFSGEVNHRFTSPPKKIIFGDSDSLYWYKAHFSATLLAEQAYYLEIPYPLLDKINIWFKTPDNKVVHYQAGSDYAFTTRAIKNPSLVFKLPASDDGVDVVMSINSSSLLTVSMLLWEKTAWHGAQTGLNLWYGFFIGGIVILIIYNLFLALALRDRSYIYYIGYLMGVSFINIISSGYSDAYLWRESAGVGTHIMLALISTTVLFGILFINRLLDVREHFPKLWKASIILILLIIPPALIDILGLVDGGPLMSFLIGMILLISNMAMLYYLIIAIASYHIGVVQARFVIVAYTTFVMGYCSYQLFLYQVVTPNMFVVHALEASTLIEGLLLALALADRINLLKKKVALADKSAVQKQQTFSKQLILAQEVYCEKFSNTLHDSVGHDLLILKQNLKNIIYSIRSSSNEKMLIENIDKQVVCCHDIFNDIRNMSHDLHPHMLKRLGLKAAIEATMERALSNQNIEWEVDIEETGSVLDIESESLLYRIVQEALTNIVKHAQATQVILSLLIINDDIVLNIKDDGLGFDVTKTKNCGLGLATITGRLQLLGGSFRLDSKENAGVHLTVSIPING